MNHSATEPNSGPQVSLETLLDEVEVLMFRFVRLMGSLHEDTDTDALSPPQYMLLRALDSGGAMRITEVATRLGVTNPAVSMLLNSMGEAGLVARAADPEDRRATLVSVSDLGRERLAKAEVTRRGFMERVMSKLTPEELSGLLHGLHELADAIAAEKY